jgi:hypothetical protein
MLETFIAGEHSYKQEYQNQPCQTGQAAYSVRLQISRRVLGMTVAANICRGWWKACRPPGCLFSVSSLGDLILDPQSGVDDHCHRTGWPSWPKLASDYLQGCPQPTLPPSCIVSSDRQRNSSKDFVKIILVSQDLAFFRH